MAASWRQRLVDGETLVGTFVKTPSHVVMEVLGLAGLDCAVIDAEHAPFGAETLDAMLLAARAVALPALVRVPANQAWLINACLDCGAAGVMVPHVRSPADAADAVAAARYAGGTRSFSASPRAGFYGRRSIAEHRALSDAEASVWCQIEDAAALSCLDAIAAVPGLGGLFIGPVDLALSMGLPAPDAPALQQAIRAIAAAGGAAGVPVGMFVGGAAQIPALRTLGLRLFIVGSDQAFLAAQARQVLAAARLH